MAFDNSDSGSNSSGDDQDTEDADRCCGIVEPPMSFCEAIGLRVSRPRTDAQRVNIAGPAQLRVEGGRFGGLSGLWHTADGRKRLGDDFVIGWHVFRTCKFCKAHVLHNEHVSSLCCAKGMQIVRNYDWPVFTSDYRQAIFELRKKDPAYHRNCIGYNRSFCTANLVVDSLPPEHSESVYRPYDRGWNLPQAGNIVLGGRSYAIPLDHNRLHTPALQVDTAFTGVSRSVDDFSLMMLYSTIQHEKFKFIDSPFYWEYTPIAGDFPPTTVLPFLPRNDYVVVTHPDYTDATRIGEAVAFSTVGPNYYVAPHLSVPIPTQTSLDSAVRLRPLDHVECHLYPLFFPIGIGGYSTRAQFPSASQAGQRRERRNHLLLLDFLRRVLFQRCGDIVLHPRLLELLLIDYCNRSLAYNIDGILNQENARNAYMRRIIRMNELQSTGRLGNVGRYWQIPYTMPGSPAYIKKKLDDGMAVIAKYGDPSFFITMTTNKNWPEIKALMEFFGVANDPPEAYPLITVRAFRLRLTALESALEKGFIFGVGLEYLQRCVEFQIRGLSHAHIIVRLKGEQPLCSADVDKYVSARLFYAEMCPKKLPRTDEFCSCEAHKLTRLVSKFMVHTCKVGVCKKTKDEPCKKRFPYAPSEVNFISEDTGRWHYKRSEEDGYVVPYNPALLYFMECHLNVDCSTGPGSGRYIRKYQCKMADSTVIRMERMDHHIQAAARREQEQRQGGEGTGHQRRGRQRTTYPVTEAKAILQKELTEWFRTRVLTSSEAATRVLDCTIHRITPLARTLYIHLPGDHMIAISDENGDENTASSLLGSYLLRYFRRPIGDRFDNLTIVEYFSKYDVKLQKEREVSRANRVMDRLREVIMDQGLNSPPFNLRNCVPFRVVPRAKEACAYITSVQPSKTELWCLRQLLVTRAVRSFEELFDGHDSFESAAVARGLYVHDKEYQIALQSVINDRLTNQDWEVYHRENRLADIIVPAYRVVNLFITIITTCEDKYHTAAGRKSTVTTIFELFWPYLLHNMPIGPLPFNDVPKRHAALHVIAKRLHPLRIDMNDIGLESPPANTILPGMTRLEASTAWQTDILRREVARYDNRQLIDQCAQADRELTDEQLAWVNEVYQRVFNVDANHSGTNVFFLGGNAGTGKSTAIRHLLAKVRVTGSVALPCAFMAAAASIMPGGDTLHRLFKLPVEVDNEVDLAKPMQSNLKGHTSPYVLLTNTKLIVIDEISMVSRRILQCVDDKLREIHNNPHVPFGGVCVVMAGDFKQLTPVIKRADMMSTVQNSVTSMDVFKNARKTVLRQQMRVHDSEWNTLSLAIGYGVPEFTPCTDAQLGFNPVHPNPEDGDRSSRSSSGVKDGFFTVDVESLQRNNLIPQACRVTTDPAEARRFAGDEGYIIAPLNDDVIAHNETHIPPVHRELRAVNTQSRSADDRTRQTSFREVSQDMMDAFNGHGVPPTVLRLWEGARVTLLRNLNPSIGLFNGQHLRIRSISKFVVQVTIADIAGRYDPDTVHDIPRVTLTAIVCSQKIARKQFPLKLAYALTVNRSQGQTILPPRRVVIDARRDYFSHGHLYVALTRVQSSSQIMLLLNPTSLKLTSVVYQSILTRSNDSVMNEHNEFLPPTQPRRFDSQTVGEVTELDDCDVDPDSDCDDQLLPLVDIHSEGIL